MLVKVPVDVLLPRPDLVQADENLAGRRIGAHHHSLSGSTAEATTLAAVSGWIRLS
jgi:hypothetical protein